MAGRGKQVMSWAVVSLAVWLWAALPVAAQDKAPKPDDEAAKAQKLLEEFFKGDGKASEKAAGAKDDGDEARSFKEMLEGLTKGKSAEGGDPTAGLLKGLLGDSASGADACSSFLMSTVLNDQISAAGSGPDKQIFGKLLDHYGTAVQSLARKDWETHIKIAREAIALGAEIKEWPFAVPRGLFMGGFWANLGAVYLHRDAGDRTENLDASIEASKMALEMLPHDGVCADQRGLAYNNLGSTYGKRIRGEKAENLELSIAAFETGAPFLPRETYPLAWATTQNNLGASYIDRVRGRQSENQERALKAFLGALEVWTPDKYPDAWSSAKNNLSILYQRRIGGDRAENIEAAIAAIEESLTVRKKEEPAPKLQPKPVATTPAPKTGEDGENPFAALEGFGDIVKLLGQSQEGTVTVFERGRWANSQHNLANAYRVRVKGDRADNIERAIAANQASLTYWTETADPEKWAGAQSEMGEGYMLRVKGERAANVDRAIDAFLAAIKIRTSGAFPRQHLLTAIGLGQALSAKGDWVGASDAFEAARRSFRVMFGQGLNEAEARDLLQVAGPLFTDAAFAAAQRGDRRLAFEWLEDGKARLLAVALKLENLSLDAAARKQLEDLRRQIREGEAASESAEGEDKAARIASLAKLRAQLLQLVDTAEKRSGAHQAGKVHAAAMQVLPERGALVAPIVSESGGMLLLATKIDGNIGLDAVALPGLSRAGLNALLGARDQGGWLGAYNINYLPGAQQAKRLPEWFGAIGDIGGELGRLFAGPLAEALAAKGIAPGSDATVTILPVGALGLLPLSLARNPKTGHELAQDYTVAFAPSLAALVSAKSHAGPASGAPALSAIVNPTGDLPYTALEGALVASRFAKGRSQTLQRTEASTQNVLAALKGRDYWHFSSHGFFDWDEPRASGLLLAGRKPLTVGSLIEAEGLGTPRLAVLSACETGLYDIATTPNEFTGLPAAFLRLGAGGVLATLWPVNDMSTALLIARFYDFHLGEKLDPAPALRKAQDWLRRAGDRELGDYVKAAIEEGRLPKEVMASLATAMRSARQRGGGTGADAAANGGAGPFAHPYYWGGFTLTGL